MGRPRKLNAIDLFLFFVFYHQFASLWQIEKGKKKVIADEKFDFLSTQKQSSLQWKNHWKRRRQARNLLILLPRNLLNPLSSNLRFSKRINLNLNFAIINPFFEPRVWCISFRIFRHSFRWLLAFNFLFFIFYFFIFLW